MNTVQHQHNHVPLLKPIHTEQQQEDGYISTEDVTTELEDNKHAGNP